MIPEKWGPSAWTFLHYITLGYPTCPTEEQKNNYKQFFYSLQNILPCEKCKEHFSNNISKIPLTDDILNSKEKLFNWLVDIHNQVNIITGKKELSYEEAFKIYMKNDDKYLNSILMSTIIILVIVIIVYIVYKLMN